MVKHTQTIRRQIAKLASNLKLSWHSFLELFKKLLRIVKAMAAHATYATYIW